MSTRFGSFWYIFDSSLRRRFVGLILAITLSSLWNTGGIASIMPFMRILADPMSVSENTLAVSAMGYLGIASPDSFLIVSGVAVLILFVTGNAILATVTWRTIAFSRTAAHSLTSKLFDVYISQPYHYYLGRNSSEMTKNLFAETGIVIGSIVQPIMKLLSEGILSATIIIFLILVDPVISLISAGAFVGAYAVIFFVFKSVLARASRAQVKSNRERFRVAGDAFGAIKEIKLRSLEESYSKAVSRATNRLEKSKEKVQTISMVPRFILETIAFGGLLSLALILFASDYGTQQILPLISAYAFAGYRLMPAMQKVFAAATKMRGAGASLQLIVKELESASTKQTQGQATVGFENAITLRDITFSYPSSAVPALKSVSLKIRKNAIVGIAGPTGCGKTTLVDILLGLLQPQTGDIIVDSDVVDISNRGAWQGHFGYVPQAIYLSDSDIKQNIAFGVPKEDIDMDRVRFAARLASLDAFVMTLENGYEADLGERGVKISGGQKQRVGIARALYHDPDILVFDEATSALDNKTELIVMEAINKLAHRKTIILIAHRLSTLEKCDTIFLLDQGRVVDQGDYTTLSRKHAHFWSPLAHGDNQSSYGANGNTDG